MRLVIHTDGYADASAAGWAFVASGDITHRDSGALPPSPSHLAEWIAVARALAWVESVGGPGDDVLLETDSALVEKGLASRRPAMSGEAAQLRADARKALARLGARGVKVRIERVPREKNQAADALARDAAHGA